MHRLEKGSRERTAKLWNVACGLGSIGMIDRNEPEITNSGMSRRTKVASWSELGPSRGSAEHGRAHLANKIGSESRLCEHDRLTHSCPMVLPPALFYIARRASSRTLSLRPTPPRSPMTMSLVNGHLDAARATVAAQVKFDILTDSQEAVSPTVSHTRTSRLNFVRCAGQREGEAGGREELHLYVHPISATF